MLLSIECERYALRTQVPAGLNRKEAEIYSHLDPERLPHHIAIIMDGNGRWAKRRHLPRTAATPERCPAMRGKWRRLAQRPFPSMMMAMWWGSRSGSRWEKISASLRFSPAGT